MTKEAEMTAIETMVEMFKVRLAHAETVEGLDICKSLLGVTDDDIKVMQRELPEVDG